MEQERQTIGRYQIERHAETERVHPYEDGGYPPVRKTRMILWRTKKEIMNYCLIARELIRVWILYLCSEMSQINQES